MGVVKRIKLLKEFKNNQNYKIIDYLFNPRTSIFEKNIVGRKLKKILDTLDEVELQRVKQYFFNSGYCKEKLIYSSYCPDSLKKAIFEKRYNVDDSYLLLFRKIDIRKAKILVDINDLSKANIIDLLYGPREEELKDYIIQTKIKTVDDICSFTDMDVPGELQSEIINKKINMQNICEVLKKEPTLESTLMYRLKCNELKQINKYIQSLNSRNILSVLRNPSIPVFIHLKINEDKQDEIKKAILKARKREIKKCLETFISDKAINIIWEKRSIAVLKIIRNLNTNETLEWLNKISLPKVIKSYIISSNSKKIKKAINNFNDSNLKKYLTKASPMPQEIKLEIYNKFKNHILQAIDNSTESYFTTVLIEDIYIEEIIVEIINRKLNENNLIEILEKYGASLNTNILNMICYMKGIEFQKYISNLKDEEIFNLGSDILSDDVKSAVVAFNRETVKKRLSTFDNKELNKRINHPDTTPYIKELIYEILGLDKPDVQAYIKEVGESTRNLFIDNFEEIKNTIELMGIDFNLFLQYGIGGEEHNLWLEILLSIIDTGELDDFIRCKNYFFKNYYYKDFGKENNVKIISALIQFIYEFDIYYDLILNLEKDDVVLSDEDILNIRFLFNFKNYLDYEPPKTLKEISNFKKSIYCYYTEKINNGALGCQEMKDIFNEILFCNALNILDNVGGNVGLKTLRQDNINCKSIVSLIDELLLFCNILEMVNDTNNTSGLRETLRYIFNDMNTMTKIQNLFGQFEEKVTKLFELDSMYNLTSLDEARKIPGIINKELSLKYGGEVFDFSDKNYVLYSHVLSKKESVSDLVNGKSSGTTNFISMTPVSYRGQKYYYNNLKLIFAYDKILTGSFIANSINNMGSNMLIKNNSFEVRKKYRRQRGILEISSNKRNNSEALFYREGLKSCGLILPGGREPEEEEIMYHKMFELPFIITQPHEQIIDNPKRVFTNEDNFNVGTANLDELHKIINLLKPKVNYIKLDDEYTGREIAIFTDAHSMYEPTLQMLEDIRRKGIKEIYSLGDNVGFGPDPVEVFDLLEEYEVISVAGNSEYYNTLGIEPFDYFYDEKRRSQEWTRNLLGESRINSLKLYPASIDLLIGGKKVALCHFANDVRWDYKKRSTYSYRRNFEFGKNCKQFLYTNSKEYNAELNKNIKLFGETKEANGYILAKKEPLFDGKLITDYDAVIQGHVHFELNDKLDDVDILTLRAVAMGHKDDVIRKDRACYYIIKERKDMGFEVEKQTVPYNSKRLINRIYTSDLPNKQKVLKIIE